MQINYQTFKLDNGLQILLIPSDTTYSVTISAYLKSGQVLEDKTSGGLTHFLEHVALTATEKWPTKDSLNEITELNGARSNGGTAREHLFYVINVPYNKVSFGIDFIHQILYKTKFNEDNIEQERTIILDELARKEDDPWYQHAMLTAKALSTNNSPYTLPLGGLSLDVKKFSKDQLKKHYDISHQPNRILLAVVGQFNPMEIKQQIKDLFSSEVTTSKTPNFPIDKLKTNIRLVRENKKTDLILNSLVFRGPGLKELRTEDMIIAGLAHTILDGPQSSRLVKRLREKEGLVYDISTGSLAYRSFGAISVEFSIMPANYEKALKILLEELETLVSKGISNKELEHYKEYLINRNLVRYDNVHSYASLLIRPMNREKEILHLDQVNNHIRNISLKQVNDYYKKYFKLNQASIIVTGNINAKTKSIIESVLPINR